MIASFIGMIGLQSACSEETEEVVTTTFPDFPELPAIQLEMDSAAYEQLQAYRDSAVARGVILDRDKEWVKATIRYEDFTGKAKIRLKGDWPDHLEGLKWSFRIRLRDTTLMGMSEFSVQSPVTRGFLDEWKLHKACELADVMTTRYDFRPVTLNGKSLGIYAVEEHFTPDLVANYKRPPGPILRLDESPHWQVAMYSIQHGNWWPQTNSFQAAHPVPFRKKVVKKMGLWNDFLVAAKAVEWLKDPETAVDSFIDIDRTAAFYALCEFTDARHAFIWHNLRWYYHPENRTLEPVLFDGFNGLTDSIVPLGEVISVLQQRMRYSASHNDAFRMQFKHFNSAPFREAYTRHLQVFSSDSFVQVFDAACAEELELYTALLKREFPEFNPNEGLLSKRIPIAIAELEEWEEFQGYGFPLWYVPDHQCNDTLFFSEIALKVYETDSTVRFENHSCVDLVPGPSTAGDRAVTIPAHSAFESPFTFVYFPNDYGGEDLKEINYTIKGKSKSYTSKIIPWDPFAEH